MESTGVAFVGASKGSDESITEMNGDMPFMIARLEFENWKQRCCGFRGICNHMDAQHALLYL
jgi:hypothetical protein